MLFPAVTAAEVIQRLSFSPAKSSTMNLLDILRATKEYFLK